MPAFMRFSPERIEEECRIFADEIESGKYSWDEAEKKWMPVNGR